VVCFYNKSAEKVEFEMEVGEVGELLPYFEKYWKKVD